MHDPALGRFFVIDPLAEEYVYNSPYAFAENKLGRGIELEGAELLPFPWLGTAAAFSRATPIVRPVSSVSRIQRHHIVPRALRNNRIVQQARKSDFKFEGNENKVGVERFSKSTGEGRHGNHPKYNAEVQRRLGEFEKLTEGKATPEQAAEFLRNMVKELKQTIENNPDVKINDLFQLNMTVESDATNQSNENRVLTGQELQENQERAAQQEQQEQERKAAEDCANDPNCT